MTFASRVLACETDAQLFGHSRLYPIEMECKR